MSKIKKIYINLKNLLKLKKNHNQKNNDKI